MRYIKTKLAVAGLGCALLSSISTPAQAGCSETIYTGTVCFMASNFCPRGYIPATGQVIAISTETALYSLLSDNYGGNGTSNFGIPDLRGRAPVGEGQGIGLYQNITLGLMRGVQTLTLTEAQLYPHHHIYDLEDMSVTGQIKVSNSPGTTGDPAGNYLAANTKAKAPQYIPSGTTTSMAQNTVSGSINVSSITQTTVTGGGAPFYNQGPRLGLTACIADSTNLYPPRS